MSDDFALWVHPGDSGDRLMIPAESDASQGIVDYKFYCFNGEPGFVYVSQGLENHSTARISFLNMDWTRAPFGRTDYASFEELPTKPESFDEMAGLARELSAGMPFVRSDFFQHHGRPRFSELTFHPCSGFMPFDPPEWDYEVGQMLDLPRG